jgi:hypothetical protein
MKFVVMLAAAVMGGMMFVGSAEAAPVSGPASAMSEIQIGSPMTPVACRTVTRRVCTRGRCRSSTTRICTPNRPSCRSVTNRSCFVSKGRRVCKVVTRRVCR